MVSKFKLEMSQYTNVSVVVPKSAPARDPKIQEGWDEAKLGAAWNTCKEGFRAILRNAKNYDKSWKYPRNKELPDTIDELASMCKEELDLHEKIHGRDWMSTTSVVMSSEIAHSCGWPEDVPYPRVKGKDVSFNLGGSIGSPETREIINKKVLPSLGLENYMIRTFPVYEKWNPKKHIGEEKDSWGFLLQDKGNGLKRVPRKTRDHSDNSKMIYLWDISLIPKDESDSD